MQSAGRVWRQAGYIGPSRKIRAQDDKGWLGRDFLRLSSTTRRADLPDSASPVRGAVLWSARRAAWARSRGSRRFHPPARPPSSPKERLFPAGAAFVRIAFPEESSATPGRQWWALRSWPPG